MRYLLKGTAALLLAGFAALGGCEPTITASVDPQLNESELTFMRFAPDAPPLADTVVSFWAVRGENREVQIRYLDYGGYPDGVCLEFKVPGDALLAYPDGRRFTEGDSVLITIRVIDKARFDFEFEPSGLRFNADKPAKLRVDYEWADRDYNNDGVIDQRDDQAEQRFVFWRQEAAGAPWFRTVTAKRADADEARADISGFTRYAMASD